MKRTPELFEHAHALRTFGFCIREIGPLCGVSKTTVENWLSPTQRKTRNEKCNARRKNNLAYHREAQRQYRQTNKARRKADVHTCIKYRLHGVRKVVVASGFSSDSLDYEIVIKQYTGFCSICGKAWKDAGTPAFDGLCIDHDHATGKFRGFLCNLCNTALGGFRDSPDLLNRAIGYLQRCT